MPVLSEARLRELIAAEQGADVDATLAALRGAADPETTTPPGTPPADPATPPADPATPPANPATPPATPPAPAPDPAPAPSSTAPEPQLVTMSAGQFASMQADASWAGAQRRAQALDRFSDRFIPAERSTFAEAMERDEAGTTALLEKMAPKFPLAAVGADNAPTVAFGAGPADADWDAFEAGTFGLEQPAKA